jgi:hypothetical protein
MEIFEMKKAVSSILILMLLNLYTFPAWAEISQDLDPMVPVDSQETFTEEASMDSTTTGEAGHGVSSTFTKTDEMKTEKPKKEKIKKNSAKKSSSKKKSKSSSKDCKVGKNSSR